MKKNYEELDMTDDFMFGKIMSNKELCRETLETLLEIPIEAVEFPERQKSINITSKGKSVRLDVYVQDEKETVYDAEMQQGSAGEAGNKELPQRSRYYQGMIDLNLLEKGLAYCELNECFIIFICTFDPFGQGLHRYTFRNICLEDKGILLEDKSIKVFFNIKSTANDVSQNVRNLLEYLNNRTVNSELTEKLDLEVKRARQNEIWRREYMKTLVHDMDMLQEGREEGIKEGIKEGEERLGRLVTKLLDMGKNAEIQLVASDAKVREEYYKKYGI